MNGPSGIDAKRMAMVVLFMAGSTLALTFRLGYLQVLQYNDYREQAQEEHWSRQTVIAQRAAIRDSGGRPLAMTATVFDIYLDLGGGGSSISPDELKALAGLLKVDEKDTKSKAAEKGLVLIKRNVDYVTGREILERGFPGVKVVEEVRRVYPEGNLAATLLGFVGKDRVGLAGIEADFDRELGGVRGTLLFERDSMGAPIPLGYRERVPPQPGGDLILTIDRFIQRLAEQKLDEAMSKHKASGGTIIVMEPKTGAILAMASRPTFDLKSLDLSKPVPPELYRNRAITDMYEPGSTFKVITMSAALDTGLVTPQTAFFDGGSIIKYGWPIDTWDGKHHGTETMTQVLLYSCNVGAVWVSDLLGPDRFYRYVSQFGFGNPTNLGLSGEAKGQVRTPRDPGWSPVDLATNSFGQGISITPLQMITAVNAIANGGNLMRPYVVKGINGPQGTRTFQPVLVRRVISSETSAKLRAMTQVAGEDGTRQLAAVPQFSIGGKTGTASIPTAGGYGAATIGSFVGFAPVDDPKFTILVKIDEPKDTPWGSLTAAPIFSFMAQQILIYWNVPPKTTKDGLVLSQR